MINTDELIKMGLTSAEAEARLAKDGYNESDRKQKRGFLRKFFAQFADLMIIIL